MGFKALQSMFPELTISFGEEGYAILKNCIGSIIQTISYGQCWDTDIDQPMGELDGELEIGCANDSVIRLTTCHCNGIVIYESGLILQSFDGLEWRRVKLHETIPWRNCVGHRIVQLDLILNPNADCVKCATSGIRFVLDNGLSIGYDHLVIDSPRISFCPDWGLYTIWTLSE